MTTLVIHKNDEPLHVQAGVSISQKDGVVDAFCSNNGFQPQEINTEIILGPYTANTFNEVFEIVNDEIVGRVETLEEVQAKKAQLVTAKYNKVCNGTDPTTGKDIYVDCTVNGTTYRMNAGKNAAENMDAGVRIFELSGADHMPIVRDFYNVNHTNVPIADARSIALQQGVDALNHWQQKGAFVDAINAATTVEEVQAVDITFTVNVE